MGHLVWVNENDNAKGIKKKKKPFLPTDSMVYVYKWWEVHQQSKDWPSAQWHSKHLYTLT